MVNGIQDDTAVPPVFSVPASFFAQSQVLNLLSPIPINSCAVLSSGSICFSKRVPAVARELRLPSLAFLSDADRRLLIAAIFDPRVAPTSVEGGGMEAHLRGLDRT